MTAFALPAPGLRPIDLLARAQATTPKPADSPTKARAAAENFESVFLNSMLQQMYTGIDGDGPFGGGGATGVWRSFLTQAYAKTFAQAGGIGIADQVYKTLLGQQEAQQ